MNLENSLKSLAEEGKLKKQRTDINYLNSWIYSAKRNFEASKLVKGNINEAAFKLCYDGLLQIGRVILLLNGFRPSDGEQHKTTFSAASIILGREYDYLIRKIQKYRIKRNNCIYDPKIFITGEEAKNIYITAQRFWSKIKKYLLKENLQLDLFEKP